jgi:hypothetical protein
MMRATCTIPDCHWTGQWWMFGEHAENEAVWHAYKEHQDEWKVIIGDRPPRNEHPPDIPSIEELTVLPNNFTTVTSITDVTDEIKSAAESIYDGWYANVPQIDWYDFIDRLDGIPLIDGTTLDLGNNMQSPAILVIIKHIRKYKKEGKR